MAIGKDVTNPGLVNVANQGDGLTLIDQEITTSKPSSNSGPTVNAADEASGKGLASNNTAANSPSSR
jgi:hypothetical protein